MLLVAVAVVRGSGRVPVAGLAGVVLGVMALVSFAWSVRTTGTRQAFADFDGAARLWELALGRLLALAVTRVRMPGGVAAPLGSGSGVATGMSIRAANPNTNCAFEAWRLRH